MISLSWIWHFSTDILKKLKYCVKMEQVKFTEEEEEEVIIEYLR